MSTSMEKTGGELQPRPDEVSVTIDGFELAVPKGTLVIRAAELLGIQIPRFCDHPLLDPVGACRQCLVEVEGQRKPLASCTTVCTDGMVVKTQLTSEVADKAQRGNMEFLLLNHPLDCPVCDKGGECPLQNQAMSNGYAESRFHETKRTYPKPVAISSQVLLDRERCVLCARCTRFSQQIAGDPFIELMERGALEQVGIAQDEPFQSYFSGNTVQICPVGALTGASYRFRARPFDLVSTPSMCEHCASGCQNRNDHRRGRVLRRLAGDDPEVNEEWNCDKGRWAFTYATQPDRLTHPLVRGEDGRLEPASWPEALSVAARGLATARASAGGKGVGVLPGGRCTVEDAYAYAKFARVALGTNDVDMRARPHSDEETEFLAAMVAGRGLDVTYTDLENAPAVLLVGFEPEEESPIVFLRLRKAALKRGLAVYSVAPFASDGLTKMMGRLVASPPGGEPEVLGNLITSVGLDEAGRAAADALRAEGSVICVGERLAGVPGGLSAVVSLANATRARLAWVPRRAGERGAIEAGALPNLLPGGRPVADAGARADVQRAWATSSLPDRAGRDTSAILAAAAAGELEALVVGGVDPYDLPDPAAALEAIENTPFVVSLELRASAVTDRADVVFPVAAVAEKSGTFVDWEGRARPFETTLHDARGGPPRPVPDLRVLHGIADEMDLHLGLPDVSTTRHEIAAFDPWSGKRASEPNVVPRARRWPGEAEAVLATWPLLLDAGRMQDGEPYLAGTAKGVFARLSPETAREIRAGDSEKITVATDRGAITVPLELTEMPERVVWLPTNSEGCAVRRDLGVDAGAVVRLLPAEAEGE
ncbi:MAG: NADH-quinone oxidoreductase subunit G [Streptosporangiales bacterium]|nr:NADH-quinone oxidoreductase subunit G [Streptosporangiales bacterium]